MSLDRCLAPRKGYSLSRACKLVATAALLVAIGFAVRYGEDNQVGETNIVSFYIFIAAGVCAYLAILYFAILFVRHLKNRRR